MIRLYIFDKDGTLIDPGRTKNRPANTPDEQALLPGVAEKISILRKRSMIAIATNQGGVAWGFISVDQARRLVEDAAQKIGGVDAYAFCPHDSRAANSPYANPVYAIPCTCRKPQPGMLLGIMKRLSVCSDETIFVGDSEDDRLAAEAAGCRFVWAKDFF